MYNCSKVPFQICATDREPLSSSDGVLHEIRMSIDRKMLGDLMRQQEPKYETVHMADVVENAMNLQVRCVRDVMTPIEKVFMISDKTEVNAKLKRQLNENRHTRIPVYKGSDRNC
ncbi:hypothetical protein TELCIR_17976, partial [Teladorsagia circumcincta]